MGSSIQNMPPDLDTELLRVRMYERFGEPRAPERRDPLDELVRTILSQNTTDRNRDRAYRALRSRFAGWEKVLEAPAEELAAVIAPAGLGPTRSRRIRDILGQAYGNDGKDLLELCSMDSDDAMEVLLSLKGVGPKTAACVLLFSCGHPFFPVDTHIYRVAGRLGLLPEGADRVKAHRVLGDLFSPGHYLEIHLNMIRLGREVCRPSRPHCQECPLADLCMWAKDVHPEPGKGARR